MIEIKDRWTDAVIYRSEKAETLRDAVIEAVANRARLDGASLVGARLDGASLVGARLVGARLDGARLDGARLDGASLDGASLVGASLDGASLNYNTNMAGVISDMNFIQVGGIGSAKRMTTYCPQMDKVWCGCFTGTFAEFEARVEETHENHPNHLTEYRAALAFFKSVRDLVMPKQETTDAPVSTPDDGREPVASTDF